MPTRNGHQNKPNRISSLNDRPVGSGRWVLYWMQQSQRADDNPALEVAIDEANRVGLPVLVVFALTDGYPEANLRHYRFMLEGLADTRRLLAERGIKLLLKLGDPPAVVSRWADQAALVVCDVGYTRHQVAWRRSVAQNAPCRVIAVEGDVIVPTGVVSAKAEYAARTIRPKIHRHLDNHLVPCPRYIPEKTDLDLDDPGLDLDDIDGLLNALTIDRKVHAVSDFFIGGPSEATRRLSTFIENSLENYAERRNAPELDATSHMSPYLHFGQISPVTIALAVRDARTGGQADREAYLEELIVRRELAMNFVRYTPQYDRYACLPAWARKSLAEHAADRREFVYSAEDLAAGRTHDPYWNAAMTEMRETGYMHNYMRMYWGKKIIEWSETPEAAFDTALALNNLYFLDGRDPNSFAGVAWVFGLHDRAWFERDIFGKVRYMAASGLERKFDIKSYVDRMASLDGRTGALPHR